MTKTVLPVVLTSLSELELATAVYLRVFRKELLPREAHAALELFSADVAEGVFEVRPLSSAVFERAKVIARTHTQRLGVRTIDVLHVAAALALQADSFITFDQKQGRWARAEGLAIL